MPIIKSLIEHIAYLYHPVVSSVYPNVRCIKSNSNIANLLLSELLIDKTEQKKNSLLREVFDFYFDYTLIKNYIDDTIKSVSSTMTIPITYIDDKAYIAGRSLIHHSGLECLYIHEIDLYMSLANIDLKHMSDQEKLDYLKSRLRNNSFELKLYLGMRHITFRFNKKTKNWEPVYDNAYEFLSLKFANYVKNNLLK